MSCRAARCAYLGLADRLGRNSILGVQRGGLANGWTTRKRTASGEAPARPRAGRGLVGGPT